MQASEQLALHLVEADKWLNDWRIKLREQKCNHVPVAVAIFTSMLSSEQSKILRAITGAPRYTRNKNI